MSKDIYIPSPRKTLRNVVLSAAILFPSGVALAACGDEISVQPPEKLIVSTGEHLDGKFSTDPNQYPFKVTVETGIPQSSYKRDERVVEFYTSTSPQITDADNLARISLPGPVFCPKDKQGDNIGCSNDKNIFLSYVEFLGGESRITIAKRPENETAKKALKEKTSAYQFKTVITFTTEKTGQEPIEIYSQTQELLKIGSQQVVKLTGVYCPEDNQERLIGCGENDRTFEYMLFFGGIGSTVITPNPDFKE